MITVQDYLKNKEKCEVCGEKRFFSQSAYGITIELKCSVCNATYIRNEDKKIFELQNNNLK